MTSLSSYGNVKNLLIGFVILNAIFLFSLNLFPFIDLPNHLAEAAIYKFYGEPGNAISQYYQPTPWYFPNTFHTVFCSLFPDVEMGNRIFHILYILLLQLSLYLVIRQLNGNPWYGLLGILFTFNYNVTFGFVGYAISIPVIVIIFYLTLRDLKEDRISLKVAIAALLVVVFLMHAQNALFALLLYGLMVLYRYWKSISKLLARAILIPLPLVVLIFSWWFTRGPEKEESTGNYLVNYYLNDYVSSLLIRLRVVVFDNFQLQEGLAGLIIAALFFSCVILPLLYFRPWKTLSIKQWLSGDTVYAFIFFFTSLACYVLLPDKLPGQTPLAQRFCTIVILSFIVLASTWLHEAESRNLKFFVSAAAVCYVFLWFEYLYSFNMVNQDFNRNFFKGIENKSRLTGLIYHNKFRGRKVYIHYPNYFLVWNQGIVTSKIIDYRFGVVRRLVPESDIPSYEELIGEFYKPVTKYSNMDYILVRGEAPVVNDINLNNFILIKKTGVWSLYKNNNLRKLSIYYVFSEGV
jgi:hypothetical protein